MATSINKVFLTGRVGKDADVTTVKDGVKVAKFSLATSTGGYKNKDGRDIPEVTQWHRIIAWRGLANFAEKIAKKGALLSVQGEINYGEYTDDKGVTHYTTDIVASDIVGVSEPQQKTPQQAPQQTVPGYANAGAETQKNDDLPF